MIIKSAFSKIIRSLTLVSICIAATFGQTALPTPKIPPRCQKFYPAEITINAAPPPTVTPPEAAKSPNMPGGAAMSNGLASGAPVIKVSNPINNQIDQQLVSQFISDTWKNKQRHRFMLVIVADKYGSDSFDVQDTSPAKIAETFNNLYYEGATNDNPPLEDKPPLPVILSGAKATTTAITDEIKKYSALSSDDSLLIYILAHGEATPNDFKFYTYDSFVTMTTLVDVTSGIKAPIYIVLDSCNSGKAIASSKISTEDLKNTVVIAASPEDGEAAFMKDIKASAFSYFFNRAVDEDWDFADDNHDGVITFFEINQYLQNRLSCAVQHNDLTTENKKEVEPKINGGGDYNQPLAFKADKITTQMSPFWDHYQDQHTYALLTEHLRILNGNLFLINKVDSGFKINISAHVKEPLIYSDQTVNKNPSNAQIQTAKQKLEFLSGYETNNAAALTWGNNEALNKRYLDFQKYAAALELYQNAIATSSNEKSYRQALRLTAYGAYNSAIKMLAELEIKPDTKPDEQFYLLFGLAERFAKNLNEAVAVYDRGLTKFPAGTKLMMEKAATIVLLAGDATGKDSINLFLKAIEIELKRNPKLSIETQKSVDSFWAQLQFLQRTGDLSSFDEQLAGLKEKYKPSN